MKKEILYIDDNSEILDFYKEALYDDIKVVVCTTEEDFEKLLESRSFDAVLFDVYLDGTTGFDVFKKVYGNSLSEGTPVFFISSEQSEENKLKAFSLGCDDFLDKLMSPTEISTRILTRMNNAEKRSLRESIVFGDIEIDVENTNVLVAGKRANLSNIEYRILFQLIKAADERPGKEISRLELTKLVWEFSWDTVTAHLLSTHMGSLRRKLNSQTVEVKTLRGRGMVLVISQ